MNKNGRLVKVIKSLKKFLKILKIVSTWFMIIPKRANNQRRGSKTSNESSSRRGSQDIMLRKNLEELHIDRSNVTSNSSSRYDFRFVISKCSKNSVKM